MAVLSGRWCLTFVFGQLRNLSFSIKVIYRTPRFHRLQALGSQPWWRKEEKGTSLLTLRADVFSFLAFSKYFTNLFASLVSGEFEVTLFFVPGIKNKLTIMPLASNTNDFVNAKSQAREKPLLTGYFSLAFLHTLPNLALCNLPFLSSF